MDAAAPITYREAFSVWVKIGLNSFGGPAGQIAVMHRVLVEEKRWISEERFLHALNYCMLLPGPEAMQLATYIGWLLHGTRGGLAAGILFVLPGFLSILVLSILYAGFQQITLVAGLFFGLKPAVLAVVVQAVIRIGRKALTRPHMGWISAAAFVAIFFFTVPFPVIICAAAAAGWWMGRTRARRSDGAAPPSAQPPATPELADASAQSSALRALHAPRPTMGRTFRVVVVWLVIWWGPLLVLGATFGFAHVLAQEGWFFSKMAVVTFGGAYAVLAYVAQQAVDRYQWLYPHEMLDGLGMAETTPGPLIQVVQFVAFMGAFRHPDPFSPMTAGVLASLVATWATFSPCFLWIFAGAPYIESLRSQTVLRDVLSGITAAVVGVILNLALWFGLHTLFDHVTERMIGPLRLLVPDWATLDTAALVLVGLAAAMLFRFRIGMIPTLLLCGGLGAAYRFFVHS